jgi:hypothetical protein
MVKNMHERGGCEEGFEYSGCCCRGGHHGHGHFQRRFMTKTEKIEKLEKYAQDMKNELTAVQERLKELKGRK